MSARRLALAALLAASPALGATANLIPPGTELFTGPADWSSPASPPTAEHAAVRLRSAGWDGATYRVEAGVPVAGPADLTLLLWCDTTPPLLPGRVGTHSEVGTPLGVVTLTADREPRARGACTAAIAWRVAPGGRWVGKRWPAPSATLQDSRKVAAATLRESQTVAAAPSSGPVTSLPYRARLDPWVGLPPAGLQVCYLGAQTLPGPVFAGETHCPGDTRTSVTIGEWVAACRSITADRGVTDAELQRIQTACRGAAQ